MSVKSLITIIISTFFLANFAIARTPSPEGAQVYFVSPTDGATVSSPVTVIFGLKGLGVAPAGIDKAKTGHHHLLIDAQNQPAMDKPLPAGDHHKHFGDGQTETTIKLSPGKHTLQLIMGDMNHIPHNPPVVSKIITVIVK